jgi:putative SOS response-associated peptidase YedK
VEHLPLTIRNRAASRREPHAIAMKDGSLFGIGGLWENWKDPTSGEWMRTFAIITTDANELVDEIHDRMPLILAPTDYTRWLSDEPDPGCQSQSAICCLQFGCDFLMLQSLEKNDKG